MIRNALVLTVVLALCATSDAAVRIFSTDAVGVSVTDSTFELSPTWFSSGALNDTLGDSEIISTASIQVTQGSTWNVPDGTYDLSRVDYHAFYDFGTFNGLFLTFTMGGEAAYGTNGSYDFMFLMGDNLAYSPGAEIPDGTSTSTLTTSRIQYDPAGTPGDSLASDPNLRSATISTVPEPSAFAFGGLALAVTGVGRWARRRFFA